MNPEIDQAMKLLADMIGTFWRELTHNDIPEHVATLLCGQIIDSWMTRLTDVE